MRKDKMSSEKSRAGNGFVSRGFVKIVYEDGDRINAVRGTVINIDETFVTLLTRDGGKQVSINKAKILKIVNPAELGNSEVGQ